MDKKNILVMTLVTSFILVFSTFSGIAGNSDSVTDHDSLEVVKEVWDGENWVNQIDADYGDTVTFKITVTYYNVTEPAHPHYAQDIVITDHLPDCLEYEENSCSYEEPVIVENNLTWDLEDLKLYHEESFNLTFNATVIDYGTNVNFAEVEAYEHCTTEDLYGSDTATVVVDRPNPSIDVEKKVWDGICDWKEEIYAKYDEIVRFNITVHNDGEIELLNVIVNDTLPESLEYANNAEVNGTPYEPTIEGKNLIWTFNKLDEDEKLYIEFDARVIGEPCSVDINWVDVSGEAFCDWIVEDRDSATVKIEGMCMEKQVWNDELGEWAEETTVPQGENVRFRITLYYYGDYKLYNIKVTDVLPDCLEYDNNAIPEEPEISGDGKTLWWNLSEDYELYDGDSLIIEFDATATEFNCEDPAVNWAYIVADECSGQEVTAEDSATVYVICGLTANAGGPYSGEINEDITITGSASGGQPPYTYAWDMDEDGEYDDATGNEITWQWENPGTKTIWLKVTDDNGDEDTDYATVEVVLENDPPNKPSINGAKTNLVPNQKYYYEIKAVDPDGDQVYFYIEWGDGDVKDWFGPYDSGEIVTVNHSWASPSTTFTIRVTAKDTYDAESDPSTLVVSTPKNKIHRFPLLERLAQHFKIIQRILTILETLLNI